MTKKLQVVSHEKDKHLVYRPPAINNIVKNISIKATRQLEGKM